MAKRELSSDIKGAARSKAYDQTHDLKEDDSSGSRIPSGNHCINPAIDDVRLERVARCWGKPEDEKFAPAVIRILGKVDETDQSRVLPGRLGPELGQLGGMSFYGPCATGAWIGCSKDNAGFQVQDCKQSTFIITPDTPSKKGLKYRKETYECKKEGVPFWNLPYPAAYQVMRNACEEGVVSDKGLWDPSWTKLFTGKTPAIPEMKLHYYAVCVVYELGVDMNTTRNEYHKYNPSTQKRELQVVARNGVPYGLADDDEIHIVWMTKPCGDKILALCQKLKEDGWDGDSDANPSGLYTYGDPCGVQNQEGGIDGGVFFTLFNPKVWQPENSKNTTWNGVVPDPDKVHGYECRVSRYYIDHDGRKHSTNLTPEQVEKFVLKRNKPGWADPDTSDEADQVSPLLKVVSIEEEASLVARGFSDGQVKSILNYFWASHPEYLDFPDVAAIVRDRKSFTMPEAAFVGEEEESDREHTFVTPSDAMAELDALEEPVKESEDDSDEFDDGGPTKADLGVEPAADDGEFEGGEIEATVTADDDDEFDEFASAFSSDLNEEDESKSDEFDPEEEAQDVEASMEDSMNKANSALSTASQSQRQSPRRKLKKKPKS